MCHRPQQKRSSLRRFFFAVVVDACLHSLHFFFKRLLRTPAPLVGIGSEPFFFIILDRIAAVTLYNGTLFHIYIVNIGRLW